MKWQRILPILLLSTATAFGQGDSWKANFDNKPDFLLYETEGGRHLVGTTKRDICVLDGKTGEKVWSATFNDLAGAKTVESQSIMEEAGVIFLSDKRMGKDNIFCVDLENGKLLWQTSDFQNVSISNTVYFPDLSSFAIITKDGLVTLDAQTGKQLWAQPRFKGAIAHNVYIPGSNELVLVNFKTGLGALFSGFKNQLMRINASTGELVWESEYRGMVPTTYYGGSPLTDLSISGNRIFCLISGMQVFDFETGMKVWDADFELYDYKVGLGSETYVYGGIPRPLVVGDDIYIVRVKHASPKVFIEKRNVIDGQVYWSTQMESKPDAIPHIELVDGKLVFQLGGEVVVDRKTSSEFVRKREWMSPFRVETYDAATGKFLWKTSKLKKRITNPVVVDNVVYVADASSFYALDLATGATINEKKLKEFKVGEAKEFHLHGDKIGILGEKGFAMINKDFKTEYFVKMKEPYSECLVKGGNILMMNKKEMQVIDLDTGKELMSSKREKNTRFSFSPDGSYIVTMGPKGVQRYSL